MKAGWKTTEFWLTMLTSLITLVGAFQGVIPENVAAIIIAAANSAYGFIRAITKAGNNATALSG